MLRRRGRWAEVAEWVEIGIGAVVFALLVKGFALQAYHISSGSMRDTLLEGDFIFIDKLSFGADQPLGLPVRMQGFREPARDEVLVFRFPRDPEEAYVKRCVGLPGDRIRIEDGRLLRNGEPVEEPYAQWEDAPRDFDETVVPDGHYFMLGDNRSNSRDSRNWGALPVENVLGRAAFIYFSWNPDANRPRLSRILDAIR